MLYRAALAASLIIFLLGVAAWSASLWIVSYRNLRSPQRGEFSASLQRGELWLTTGGTFLSPGFGRVLPKPSFERLVWRPTTPLYERRAYSFGTVWSVRFPIWYISAAGLGLGASLMSARSARRMWRRRHGRCARCGYPVATNSDRCSECGATPRTSRPQRRECNTAAPDATSEAPPSPPA